MTYPPRGFHREIQDAALATFNADSWLGINGTGAVATREVTVPQPDGKVRQLKRDDLPYLGLRCEKSSDEQLLQRTVGLVYDLGIIVVTESGDSREAVDQNVDIRDRALYAIKQKYGSGSWIASGYTVMIGLWRAEEPKADPKIAHRWTSQSLLEITVVYPEE